MTLLRGRREGLEIRLSPHDLAGGYTELQARLTERPSFYRGAAASVDFAGALPSREDLARLRALLSAAGIELRGIAGFAPQLERLAADEGLGYEAPREQDEPLERPRPLRPRSPGRLSESARSLVADFAGARGDIAQRRRRGEASVPPLPEREGADPAPALRVVEPVPSTLYRTATLRGGQALHHTGNVVVVGDVNPGAEIVATGDVLVFGRLAGIAHAGARGDESARIYAVALCATQLRIAALIAADLQRERDAVPGPEVALASEGRILVSALDRLDAFGALGAAT